MSLITGQNPADPGQAPGSPPGSAPGNQITDWRTSLPDDLRSEKVFESIKGKDWAEAGPLLAKNYMHAQRLVGADKLVLPTERSTPEEIAAFRTKLGVPGKPDEYAYKLPEGLTEDRIDKARVDTWRKEMHEAGIPKIAADRLLSKYLAEEHGSYQAQIQAKTKALEQGELSLKQEFGDKFDEKVNYARLALRTFGNDELSAILEQTGLGSNPAVVKLFSTIGEKLGDDRARGNGGASGNVYASPELAQGALNDFNRNSENMKALFDKGHMHHDAVVAERAKLFAAAFPTMKSE
jgi:hypothetical protein